MRKGGRDRETDSWTVLITELPGDKALKTFWKAGGQAGCVVS